MIGKTRGGFYISRIKHIQGRLFERLLKENGIEEFNGAHGRILFVLWQEDNLTISQLGERTSLAKTTLTSMLDRMEEKGNIQRNFDLNDRRQIRITLTEKAKALDKIYQSVSEQMNELFYAGFTDQEIIQFDHMLERILKNLKAYEE
ncbi:MarR family transcriptional regulator [Paenibacillus aurantius]|uniref:MarR family transcriptional regulator n=1 Tax=Paenibacillus aurantius TaxID=2918900 RepID=A0AA96LE98_9BACL|nr:MarR family transcriptional regulator [Paenibacillus aurantius]WNQ12111.1 MarR family transcriptional regulator [Paenibacillus aurantius]